MEKEKLPGTIKLWPGVAEEELGSKAFYVRDGFFKDVDVVLFSHVASNFGVSWGDAAGTGLVSIEYSFTGESAHAAGAPWRGKSALDAVELMDVGWNFKREHLRLSQRSHYVITNGGDQPNVVPSNAAVWYYFRETDYLHIQELWETGNSMAQGAAMMTGTTVKWRIIGSAWPQHFNKVVAETMYKNIQKVGMPTWSDADQTLAKGLQKEIGVPDRGLSTNVGRLGEPVRPEANTGGGSDDIGDVSWNVPTITLRYPANIPNLPGHNWTDAIAMATPIAHKGVTAGAKAMAMTMVDLLTKPELIKQAWDYYHDVQTKETKYKSFIGPKDKPSTFLNEKTMAQYREQMKKYYYDPSKYDSYLDQLGIKYPTVKTK
jgi:aminobenzoyl-glutamate utilization protein B